MKPRAKKAASKRQTCHMRYKIEKKVKEHHRKLRKLEKLKGTSKLKKDMGVPNLHPFKEQLLEKAAAAKVRREEQERRQKQSRRELMDTNRGLHDMVQDAQARGDAFKPESVETLAASAPAMELSRKQYYQEVKKVIDASDVVLQVLDARDPLTSRSLEMESRVLGSRKKLVLLLNKVDLVPKGVVQEWLTYLRNEAPTLPFKASSGVDGGSKGVGALMQLLANYSRSRNLKTAIRVGLIGRPNTGKSSVVNALKREKAVGVAPTPGFTTTMQEIHLTKNITLIDSPGIVFGDQNSDNLILHHCVRLETLDDPIKAVEQILRRCNHYQLMEKYNVPQFASTLEFLQHLARRLGKMKKGGVPDCESAARSILQDWNAGRISFFTSAPETQSMSTHVSSSIVSEMGEAFDIDALLRNDAEVLGGDESIFREDVRTLPKLVEN